VCAEALNLIASLERKERQRAKYSPYLTVPYQKLDSKARVGGKETQLENILVSKLV
jgi:hypothetical protein